MNIPALLARFQMMPWWYPESGIIALGLFAVAAGLSQVILLPITAFAIAAGFLFGFSKGVITMLAAKMIGACLNFGLSRSFATTPALWLTRRFPLFEKISALLKQEGLHLAILMRLCPFPFAVASYGYGLTQIRFRHYVIATFVGTIGPSLVFVGIGVSMKNGLEVLEGGHPPKSPWEMGLLLLGIVAAVGVTRKVSRIARNKLNEQTSDGSSPAN